VVIRVSVFDVDPVTAIKIFKPADILNAMNFVEVRLVGKASMAIEKVVTNAQGAHFHLRVIERALPCFGFADSQERDLAIEQVFLKPLQSGSFSFLLSKQNGGILHGLIQEAPQPLGASLHTDPLLTEEALTNLTL